MDNVGKLYTLSTRYAFLERVFDEHIDPDTGEITGDIVGDLVGEMELVSAEREDVALAVATDLRQDEMTMDMIRAEEKRLAKMRKACESRAETKRNALDRYMRSNGIVKVNGMSATIGYRKSEAVVVDNEAELPESYFRVKKEVDKAGIKAAIKKGQEVAGAHIEKRESLYVK